MRWRCCGTCGTWGCGLASLKVGPDYIDPAFHAAASGRTCGNLDPWAMREATLDAVLAAASEGVELVVVEGVMGLFDGATAQEGSTADVAAATGWPVVLVVDAGAMAASAAAVVHGFASFRDDVEVAGVIFNRVGSDRHAKLLVEATVGTGISVLGCIRRDSELALPDRASRARPGVRTPGSRIVSAGCRGGGRECGRCRGPSASCTNSHTRRTCRRRACRVAAFG